MSLVVSRVESRQAINDSCPVTQLNDGLTRLHEANDDAVNWLKTKATTALIR